MQPCFEQARQGVILQLQSSVPFLQEGVGPAALAFWNEVLFAS